MREIYLQLTSSGTNANKYYHMIPVDDLCWKAEYGRVGAKPQVRGYPASVFDKKLREKLAKGYTDVTELHARVPEKSAASFKEIADKSVKDLVDFLLARQKRALQENYVIEAGAVTEAMVEEAERYMALLRSARSAVVFNGYLEGLFRALPRRMSKVGDYLAKSPSQFQEIIDREQALLDIMKSRVSQDHSKEDPDRTILEYYGLDMRPCTQEEVAEVKDVLGESKDLFYKAWKVTDRKREEAFRKCCEEMGISKKLLLCHGSRTENWLSILVNGLILRPNAVITGKLFGIGIYFARKAKKSIGYTSLEDAYWTGGHSAYGFLGIMEVGYGTPLHVKDDASCWGHMTGKILKRDYPGKSCLHAHAGANMGHSRLRNDEIVIYREDQCCIKYLVELKAR